MLCRHFSVILFSVLFSLCVFQRSTAEEGNLARIATGKAKPRAEQKKTRETEIYQENPRMRYIDCRLPHKLCKTRCQSIRFDRSIQKFICVREGGGGH